MNRLIIGLILILANCNFLIAAEFKMTCDLRVPTNSKDLPHYPALKELLTKFNNLQYVDILVANSKTNTIELHLKDGSIEVLHPIQKDITGPFGVDHRFGSQLRLRNGKFYTKSSIAGEIYVKHYCTLGDIRFENCQSRSGEQAKRFGTILNIENQTIHLTHLFGNRTDGFYDFLCTRDVIKD